MTPRERDYVAGLCATRAGLSIETERSYLMDSRLAGLARREGFHSISELVRAVRDRGEERLVWAMVEALAPTGSAFFRDPQVFEALDSGLAARAGSGPPLRIWSAACGAGQEIYSLAMLLQERGVDGVELFASDLSVRALEKAQAGLYSALEVQQGLSARRLIRWFDNRGDGFQASQPLRSKVRWRRMNLMDIPAGVGAFDVILCRHVLDSLLPEAQARVLDHLAQALRPGGRLVLGANEQAPGFAAIDGAPGVFEPTDQIAAAA